MSTPRFYSWDDDGSPGRALTGNNQNRLKQILIPCLVTGYGDKPGAGWSVGHEHENGFSLINADGNVVNFVSNLPAQAPYPAMNANATHIYAAESLSDTSGAIIDGANLCSGNYRKGFPDVAGQARHTIGRLDYIFDRQLSSLQWTIVADNRTLILNISTESSSSHNTGSTYDARTCALVLYVGSVITYAPISGNFLALSGGIYNYNASYTVGYGYAGGYSSPINLATGLAERIDIGALPYLNERSLESALTLTKTIPKVNLQQPRLQYGNEIVGILRGVVYDDVLRIFGWEEYLRTMGFSGTDFTDRGKLVEIDGHNYAFARSLSGNSILTDNPAFW